MSRPTILLNPGPVTLTERVRNALLREDQCHREPEFAELMLDIKQRLEHLYNNCADDYCAVLVSGSGTCAVESMLSSLALNDGKSLVVANGVYGERMAAMLEAQNKPYALIKSEWPQAMDFEQVDKTLANDLEISHVIAVHNETTTGRLNDIQALSDICQRYNKPMLLDAVSSFAGEEIDFSHWNLDAVAATANKCIHGIPGMAFVLVKKSLLENNNSQSNTLYLDLFRYYKEQEIGFSPFTQAVHACFALHEALKELENAGGWMARHQRYTDIALRIRTSLAEMHIKPFIEGSEYSSMISSFHLPPDWNYQKLHDALRDAGFVIYAGQGGLYHSIFRIANMGDIWDSDVDRLLDTFSKLLVN